MVKKEGDLTLIYNSNKRLGYEQQLTMKTHYLPISATDIFSGVHTVTEALTFGLLW